MHDILGIYQVLINAFLMFVFPYLKSISRSHLQFEWWEEEEHCYVTHRPHPVPNKDFKPLCVRVCMPDEN